MTGAGTCSKGGGRNYCSLFDGEIEKRTSPEIIFNLMSKVQNIRMQGQL
jgi:hypothetical protein